MDARGQWGEAAEQIANGHRLVHDAWKRDASHARVTPAALFDALARQVTELCADAGCATDHVALVACAGNATMTHADTYLAIKPGADGAFCLGMCQVVIAENGHQPLYLKQFTYMPFLVYTSGPFKNKFVRTSQDKDIIVNPDGKGNRPIPNPAFSEYYAYVDGAIR